MPSAPVRSGVVDVLGELDVRLEADRVPVLASRRAGRERRPARSRASTLLALELAVLGELLGVGVDDHDAAVAVDDDGVAAADLAR